MRSDFSLNTSSSSYDEFNNNAPSANIDIAYRLSIHHRNCFESAFLLTRPFSLQEPFSVEEECSVPVPLPLLMSR